MEQEKYVREVAGKLKKPKNKKKKLLIFLAVLVLAAAALAAAVCYLIPTSQEMGTSGLYQAEEVEQASKEIAELFYEEQAEELSERSTEEMKEIFTGEQIPRLKAQLGEEWGAFERYTSYLAAEVKQNGQLFAVTELVALYENRSVTYRITFDEDMKLAGFYMK